MELDAVNRELAMLQSHHFAFGRLGRDLEAIWQSFTPDDEGMITRRFEWIRKVREHTAVMMLHGRSLAVHQSRRLNNLAAEHRADALMAETNAKDRRSRTESANHFVADPGILGPAGTGRDADAFRTKRLDFSDRDLVIPLHYDVAIQHAEMLDEIVGKRIVIIDDQDLIHHSPG